MRKIFITLIFMLVAGLGVLAVSASARGGDINVRINGVAVEFNTRGAILTEGRVLVPVCGVFAELGFDVNMTARSVTLTRGESEIVITVGSRVFFVNGREFRLDVPAKRLDGVVMLPIRAVLESVRLYLDWDEASRTVLISETPITRPSPRLGVPVFYRRDGSFRIPVLAYHSIMPQKYYYPINISNPWILHLDTFYAQMRYLYENNFNTVTTRELVDFLFYGGPLPINPVMLTFDDGYLDNALYAADILRQFGFTGVVFLITGNLPETTPAMRAFPTQFMSETEIWANIDVFEFGSHSHLMHRRTNGAAAFETESAAAIRGDLLRSFEFPLTFRNGFAFPYGIYSPNGLAALREVGVRFAFTTQTGYLTQNSDPLRIPRFSVTGGPSGHTMRDFSDIVRGLRR